MLPVSRRPAWRIDEEALYRAGRRRSRAGLWPESGAPKPFVVGALQASQGLGRDWIPLGSAGSAGSRGQWRKTGENPSRWSLSSSSGCSR